VRRFHQPDGRFIADAICEIDHAISEPCVIVDLRRQKQMGIPAATAYSELLTPIFRHGRLVYQMPKIEESREHTRMQLSCAPPEVMKLNNPRRYGVGVESSLHRLRSKLIARDKGQRDEPE
jgi:nicotinate phosphoribosyltransferase